MGGVGSKVICVRSKVNIGWKSGNVRSVKLKNGWREDTALWDASFGNKEFGFGIEVRS